METAGEVPYGFEHDDCQAMNSFGFEHDDQNDYEFTNVVEEEYMVLLQQLH